MSKGAIWMVMFFRVPISSRCLTWPRMTSAPPSGRRSAASSTTTHSFGASGRSSTCWRRSRTSTLRWISCSGAPALASSVTARA